MTIREASAADWPAIWTIIQEVVREGDTYTLPPDVSEEEARAYWNGENAMVYVAEAGGEVIGTYTLRANQPGLGSHVANAGYMVRSDSTGRGIGTRLAAHSLDLARAAGFRGMQFNAVVSTNTRAIALWKHLGFSIVGTIPEGFQHRTRGLVDIHIMYKRL